MNTDCEQKIMEVVLPQPYKNYSIRQMSTLIKRSYALTHAAVGSLVKKKMVITQRIGNSIACRLNLSAEPQLLAMSSLELSHHFLQKVPFAFVIDELKEKLHDAFYILLVFGSYAKRKNTKDSDLDLLFVIQQEQDIENFKRKIKVVLSSTNIKIEFEVVILTWLMDMFQQKNSVGREVLECSIVLYGAEQYYTLVRQYDQKGGH